MQTFAYDTPATLADAAAALRREDARLLAGGQSLLPAMRLGLAAPSALVDLGRLAELRGIRVDTDTVTVGAATTHAEVAAHAGLAAAIPALADLAGRIGDRQVRARGTIGGSLANDDPAACYPAAVLGLGASVVTDRRRIAADDFFVAIYTTALEEGEIIGSVSFPRPRRAAWQKFKQPASRFSLVGVFVSEGPAGVRVAVTGAGANGVFRATELEQRLAADWSPQALAGASVAPDELLDDLHGSAEYRASLIPVLAARAVAATLG